jgi:sorting nexin-1/2
MADEREPPPLFEDAEKIEKDPDSDDLFQSASEPVINTNKMAEIDINEDNRDDEEKDDLFTEDNTSEVPLDSPESEKKDASKSDTDEPPRVAVTQSTSTSHSANSNSISVKAPSMSNSAAMSHSRSKEEIDEEESGDQYSIEISVTDPKKIGDGMTAYMAYKVITKTTIPSFRKPETGVYRRFSDFLGIHEKLVEKHRHLGRIIPSPPEKSVIGMTKIKMNKEEAGSHDFIEKRRSALERFLNRTAKHSILCADSDFVDFLEQEGDLPKSTSTSSLSSAGMMRLFSKVGDSFGKISFKMDETDQWFEEKQQQIEALDQQLRKLHSSIDALVNHRKELALNTGQFAKSAAMLGNAEEHTALSRALSQLAEVEEKMDQLHMDQADVDFYVFSELIKDYINLVGAVRDVFNERVKIFKFWKEAEANLAKKREIKAKLELARKMDKIPGAAQEITEWENKCDKYQEDFEIISKNIRKEVARFEKQRVKDFKVTIINYLESLMNSQQQLIKYWETFLPEAKAIA